MNPSDNSVIWLNQFSNTDYQSFYSHPPSVVDDFYTHQTNSMVNT